MVLYISDTFQMDLVKCLTLDQKYDAIVADF